MEYLKTGFAQLDKKMNGLKRGKVYFISASDSENARGFAASLSASVDSFDSYRAIFYTDSPIPYCRCEHMHFCDMDEIVELFRVVLDGDETFKLPKTDLYVFEDFVRFSAAALKHYPSARLLKNFHDAHLYTMSRLAEEFQVTVLLTDQLYGDKGLDDVSFPELRSELSEGTFLLTEGENDVLNVKYIKHSNLDSFSFDLKSEPKEFFHVYPAYRDLEDV